VHLLCIWSGVEEIFSQVQKTSYVTKRQARISLEYTKQTCAILKWPWSVDDNNTPSSFCSATNNAHGHSPSLLSTLSPLCVSERGMPKGVWYLLLAFKPTKGGNDFLMFRFIIEYIVA
jgi:hypothetical protein